MSAAPGFGQMTDVSARIGGLDADEYMGGMGYDERPLAYPSAPPHSGGFNFHDGYVEPDDDEDGDGDGDGEEGMQTEVFTCSVCSRSFVRPCDLNKHSKTHSRPYKCPHVGCKYHELGWPTEKELERHNNDKHAPRPNTFPCLFQPCSYTSKRESNLKQHMEKSHGWHYVRSRSAKYKCPMPGCAECTNPDDSRQRHEAFGPVTPARSNSQPPLHDFVLYPDGPAPVMAAAPQHDGAYGSESPWDMRDSYVPWSPPTRGESLTKFLRSVDSTMGGIPVDPRLTQAQYPHVIQELAEQDLAASNHLMVQQATIPSNLKLTTSPPTYALRPAADVWPNYTAAKGGNPSGTPAGQTGHNTRGGAAPVTPQSGHRTSMPPKEEEEEEDEEDDEEDSEEDERPRKRGRYANEEDFSDNQMPCPFRKHDPEYFDRNNKEKYSPCHTKHKDVSTIVRHLGRPAHCLHTDDRRVHSFDVEELDDEPPRPRAGLCKRCWGIFRNWSDFDQHCSQQCSKVSRGKREKFRLLYNAFCNEPLPAQRHAAQASVAPPPSAHDAASLAAPATPAAHRESIAPPSVPPVKLEDEPPAADLAERVATLETRCKALEAHNAKLENMVRTLRNAYRSLHQHVRPSSASGPGPSSGLSATAAGPSSAPRAFFASLPPPPPLAPPPQRDDADDRGSVVAGMVDARPLLPRDAGDHGAFLSDAQRTLSGFSSTSSRSSSVRHAPPSALKPGGAGGRGDGGGGGGRRGGGGVTPKAAASNEDSGYGGSSTKENGGEVKAAAVAAVVGPGLGGEGGLQQQQQQHQQQGGLVSDAAAADFDFSDPGLVDFESVWDDRG